MTPQEIESWRRTLVHDFPLEDMNGLCELALDGLRFRAWCNGATPGGGVSTMAKLLANCTTPQMYREAIDKFIVARAKGELSAF